MEIGGFETRSAIHEMLGRGISPRLVKEHWLEIDLRDGTDDARHGKLFLTGWVFPTCTSINLAMTENPTLPKLIPPRLLVPDEHGEWKEVLPYAGFPGGKTKTIVIDLQDLFLCNDYRVRIATNMELCWDEVFWSADQRSVEGGSLGQANAFVQSIPLVLKGADLHYRDSPSWFLGPAMPQTLSVRRDRDRIDLASDVREVYSLW